MTDTRTPKQVNEALALLYEWRTEITGKTDDEGKNVQVVEIWIRPKSEGPFHFQYDPPNFCGDWAYVGPLWSELVNVYGFDDAAFTVSEQWSALRRMEHPKPIEDKKTIDTVIKEAIARATLAWKESEQ